MAASGEVISMDECGGQSTAGAKTAIKFHDEMRCMLSDRERGGWRGVRRE